MFRMFSERVLNRQADQSSDDLFNGPPYVSILLKSDLSDNTLRTAINDLIDWGPYEVIDITALKNPPEKYGHFYRVVMQIQVANAKINMHEYVHWAKNLLDILDEKLDHYRHTKHTTYSIKEHGKYRIPLAEGGVLQNNGSSDKAQMN